MAAPVFGVQTTVFTCPETGNTTSPVLSERRRTAWKQTTLLTVAQMPAKKNLESIETMLALRGAKGGKLARPPPAAGWLTSEAARGGTGSASRGWRPSGAFGGLVMMARQFPPQGWSVAVPRWSEVV